jgi:Domain of unknown function DUF29
MSRRNAVAYDEDFYAWSREQARLLREGRLNEIDAESIAEEIESLGKSDRRELRSRLTVLLTHLLKWHFQPEHRSGSWRSTIREQRRQMDELLDDSPSLRPTVGEALGKAYADARANAADECGQAIDAFPTECPYTTDELIDLGFWPGPTEQTPQP